MFILIKANTYYHSLLFIVIIIHLGIYIYLIIVIYLLNHKHNIKMSHLVTKL